MILKQSLLFQREGSKTYYKQLHTRYLFSSLHQYWAKSYPVEDLFIIFYNNKTHYTSLAWRTPNCMSTNESIPFNKVWVAIIYRRTPHSLNAAFCEYGLQWPRKWNNCTLKMCQWKSQKLFVQWIDWSTL